MRVIKSVREQKTHRLISQPHERSDGSNVEQHSLPASGLAVVRVEQRTAALVALGAKVAPGLGFPLEAVVTDSRAHGV